VVRLQNDDPQEPVILHLPAPPLMRVPRRSSASCGGQKHRVIGATNDHRFVFTTGGPRPMRRGLDVTKVVVKLSP
jgi:hypothetical protein